MTASWSGDELSAIDPREAEVKDWITGMPFVSLLGITAERATKGEAVLHLELRDDTSFMQGAGFPAATIGALIDLCAGAAVASQLPADHVVATLDFTMKMLAPIPGPVATATATAFRVGRGSAAASVEVRDGRIVDGEPSAIGLVSLRPIGSRPKAAR